VLCGGCCWSLATPRSGDWRDFLSSARKSGSRSFSPLGQSIVRSLPANAVFGTGWSCIATALTQGVENRCGRRKSALAERATQVTQISIERYRCSERALHSGRGQTPCQLFDRAWGLPDSALANCNPSSYVLQHGPLGIDAASRKYRGWNQVAISSRAKTNVVAFESGSFRSPALFCGRRDDIPAPAPLKSLADRR
jgi:hypothetical protein